MAEDRVSLQGIATHPAGRPQVRRNDGIPGVSLGEEGIGMEPNIPIETLAETDNYMIYAADEPDGERTWHLELGSVTLHFFKEEWEEFLDMALQVTTDRRSPAPR
jgi:hypothetical protein